MSKRVTLDEKRTRMLQIFHEREDFFTLKEIEKISSQEKGIVVQSVKDVLQALVDDGLVNSAKIGSAIYFWAFPGEKIVAVEQRIAETNKVIVAAEFKLQKLNAEMETISVAKEDTEERQKVIQELEQLKQKEIELTKQIANFSDCDPEIVEKINEQAKLYKEAANVWTDNIFSIQSWCKNKFDISEETLNKQFHIPEDLDYLE
ncbi:meiotic nuclear division protein 1 homolog [Diachasma alloeum]|uniref:Meiotic nuclear division protein 1 homolog n=1 Tax=Diachasma alloeum TaxID=454923 RepID=A0A4E0RYS8_9HYME|nr:meiotic nuclear division protein 1 homolog [Diachasma alloeum]XP_015126851.1 meiotic nuclear division protein 1 homolog [Diachasma alloeum]XP_028982611.1 meiotic nuclear division protein 1 homolog [Diachasma alloeum]XP_028982612.1 meiotic nuclear division protein 1 homolog [Diachasma alloeum]THK32901.1 meiotic nuclear divisions 1 [Diachasma alloeum]